MNTPQNKQDFINLIEHNKGIIIKICNAYCFNKTDREDLTQEIIYQLYKSGNSFNAASKFSTWMYRVALNVAIAFYRKEQKIKPFIFLTESHFNIEDVIEDTSEEATKLALLQSFINQLKELDKALALLYFEAKSYQEIAEILGITQTNVATKISRIKTKLTQQLLHNYK